MVQFRDAAGNLVVGAIAGFVGMMPPAKPRGRAHA
jgi:hypothetical protein